MRLIFDGITTGWSCVAPVILRATDGCKVTLSDLNGLTVIYAYPPTSPPDGNAIAGWGDIPGAKGCTPQSCRFRDRFADLKEAGAAHVFGLSTQSPTYQREVVTRLHLPFALLSDEDLAFTQALGLSVFKADGMTLLHRITLIICDGRIEHVIDNIQDPAANATAVLAYLADR